MRKKKLSPVLAVLMEEKLTDKQEIAFKIAIELRQSVESSVDLYRKYISYASEQLTLEESQRVLEKAGFSEAERSRMKAVLSLPEPMLLEYKKGVVGFNVSVEKAREEKAKRSGKPRRRVLIEQVMRFAFKLLVKSPTYAGIRRMNTGATGHYLIICPALDGEQNFTLGDKQIAVLSASANKNNIDSAVKGE